MTTPPVPVGYSFPVSPAHITKPCRNIGGYTLVEDYDAGILICGFKEVNLFTEGIGQVGIMPIDTNHIIDVIQPKVPIEQHDTNLFTTFEFERDSVVYLVTFNAHSWVFNKLNEAYGLLHVITDIKSKAVSDAIANDEQIPDVPYPISTEEESDLCQTAPTES